MLHTAASVRGKNTRKKRLHGEVTERNQSSLKKWIRVVDEKETSCAESTNLEERRALSPNPDNTCKVVRVLSPTHVSNEVISIDGMSKDSVQKQNFACKGRHNCLKLSYLCCRTTTDMNSQKTAGHTRS